MSDGLPDPMQDPVSPLLAFVMNSVVRGIGGAIEKVKEGLEALPGKVSEVAANARATMAKVGDSFSAFGEKSSAPEHGLARSKQLSQEIGAPSAIPAQAMEAVHSMAMNNAHVVASTHVPESALGTLAPAAVGFSGRQEQLSQMLG